MSQVGGQISGGQMPPGWYYAEGDPPGTHRYWDGQLWAGGPQPIQVGYPAAGSSKYLTKPADVGPRFLAFLIDFGLAAAPMIGLLAIGADDDYIGLGYLALLVIWAANLAVLQGVTGQTVGKKIMGLMLVVESTGLAAGFGKTLGRFLIAVVLHTFSCGLYTLVDLIWPLVDDRNQRLTDKMLSLAVVPFEPDPSIEGNYLPN